MTTPEAGSPGLRAALQGLEVTGADATQKPWVWMLTMPFKLGDAGKSIGEKAAEIEKLFARGDAPAAPAPADAPPFFVLVEKFRMAVIDYENHLNPGTKQKLKDARAALEAAGPATPAAQAPTPDHNSRECYIAVAVGSKWPNSEINFSLPAQSTKAAAQKDADAWAKGNCPFEVRTFREVTQAHPQAPNPERSL